MYNTYKTITTNVEHRVRFDLMITPYDPPYARAMGTGCDYVE